MPEDESWDWWDIFKLAGTSASLTGVGILDIFANDSAVLQAIWNWVVLPTWTGLFVSVKFWHLIAIGTLVAGARYGWTYFYSEEESDDASPLLDKEDIQEIKKRAQEEPDWKNSTSAHIEGVDWTWKWNGKEIVNLRPLCPKDDCRWDMELENDFSWGTGFGSPLSRDVRSEAVREVLIETEYPQGPPSKVTCDNCGFTRRWKVSTQEVETNVKREVKARIRRGDCEV